MNYHKKNIKTSTDALCSNHPSDSHSDTISPQAITLRGSSTGRRRRGRISDAQAADLFNRVQLEMQQTPLGREMLNYANAANLQVVIRDLEDGTEGSQSNNRIKLDPYSDNPTATFVHEIYHHKVQATRPDADWAGQNNYVWHMITEEADARAIEIRYVRQFEKANGVHYTNTSHAVPEYYNEYSTIYNQVSNLLTKSYPTLNETQRTAIADLVGQLKIRQIYYQGASNGTGIGGLYAELYGGFTTGSLSLSATTQPSNQQPAAASLSASSAAPKAPHTLAFKDYVGANKLTALTKLTSGQQDIHYFAAAPKGGQSG